MASFLSHPDRSNPAELTSAFTAFPAVEDLGQALRAGKERTGRGFVALLLTRSANFREFLGKRRNFAQV